MSLQLRLAGIAVLVAFVALLAALNVLSSRNRVKKTPAEHPDAGRPEVHGASEATTPHDGPMPPGIVTLFNNVGAAFQDRAGSVKLPAARKIRSPSGPVKLKPAGLPRIRQIGRAQWQTIWQGFTIPSQFGRDAGRTHFR